MPAGYKGYIDKVGVELEGGQWRLGTRTPGWKHDGSVEKDLGTPEVYGDRNDAGEVVSKPYRTWHFLRKWLLKEYPGAVDQSCGMHVHISFRDVNDYVRLMDPAFDRFFKKRMKQFIARRTAKRGPAHLRMSPAIRQLANRLNGDNRYCEDDFIPERQLYGDGGRYTQLNFVAYHEHRTVECRLLPMFESPAAAVKAIRYVLNTFEMYLEIAPPREAVEWAEVEALPKPEVQEPFELFFAAEMFSPSLSVAMETSIAVASFGGA